MSDYTWGHDNFIIVLNISIIFSCLLSAYRITIYELKEACYFISISGRKNYFIERILIVFLKNLFMLFLFLGLMYLYRKPEGELLNKFLLSIPPVILNIIIASITGVIFSPVILSIHQVIHGIFYIVVGINISAISGFFSEWGFINFIFSLIQFIFPPIEHIIRLSVSLNYEVSQIPYILWAIIFCFVYFYIGLKLFREKNLFVSKDGSLSIDG
ncbi:MAG: hypothetical protein ACQESP_02785 [Candidatus Muiribacteriota bacterium]